MKNICFEKEFVCNRSNNVGICYMICSIVLAITTGAAWGSYLLMKIGEQQSFITISIFDINAHGHAQIFFFTWLFLLGLVYCTIPHFWKTTLAIPSLAYVALGCIVIGVFTRTAGMMFLQTYPWTLQAAIIGSSLQIVAAVLFAVQIFVTYRQRETLFQPYCIYIFTSIACFFLMSVASTWHTWNVCTAVSFDDLVWYIATFQAPLRNLQIHGFMLFMIFGISIKAFPIFFDLPKISRRKAWKVWWLFFIALIAEISFFLLYRHTGLHYFASALLLPWTLYCVGTVSILRVWSLSKSFKEKHSSNKFMRWSYRWLFISLILLLLMPLYQLFNGTPFSHAYYGAIRHAITVGFTSIFLMGMGVRIFSPSLKCIVGHNIAFLLVNIGCFLRVTLQILTDWTSTAFVFVGISGILELIAFTLWGSCLIMTIYLNKRVSQPKETPYFKNVFHKKLGENNVTNK